MSYLRSLLDIVFHNCTKFQNSRLPKPKPCYAIIIIIANQNHIECNNYHHILFKVDLIFYLTSV